MTETQTPAATPPQAALITNLLAEREGYSEGFADRVRKGLETGEMSKRKASEVIDWLMNLPKRTTVAKFVTTGGKTVTAFVPGADAAIVPAGHYAVAIVGSSEPLSFFRVDTPDKGKWAGRTFVKHIVGGHPDFPVRGDAARDALTAISQDIVGAARRYAAEFTRCCHCNTQLTDPTSRAIGIGPHCRKVHAGTALIAAMLAS